MEALEEVAGKVAVAGVTYSILEIVFCFTLGKALNKMWILICAIQFIVYIGTWAITYPEELRLILHESKRVVYGEFFDDLPVGMYIKEQVMMCESEEENVFPEQKIGISRVGEKDLNCSYGSTFVAITALLVAIILLTLVALCLDRLCCGLCKKVKDKFTILKKMIFWNGIIRYVYLSSLKFMMISVVALKLANKGKNFTIAISQFALLNAIPLFCSYILAKNGKKLEDKDKMEKFGELYKERNVGKNWKHRAWALPIAYIYRRTAFSIVTVYAFDQPVHQMIVHQILTLATCVYQLRESRMYLSKV